MADAPSEAGRALVADIGGTNSRIALARGSSVITETARRYRNAELGGADDLIARYLADTATSADAIKGVCFAGAGPVRDGVAQLTNLDWRIDRETLSRAASTSHVAVLNDLQAQGHALAVLGAEQTVDIVAPKAAKAAAENPLAARLVVGLGTGFNVAPVYSTAGGRFVPPSEAGHAALPLTGHEGLKLKAGLERIAGFASIEEALSGRGLSQIHQALSGTHLSSAELLAAAQAGEESAEASLRVITGLLGHVVGDLALTILPFGGIYLTGGVARALAPWLTRFGFAEAMRDKGRFGSYLGQFPVRLVVDDDAALTGCAAHLDELASHG